MKYSFYSLQKEKNLVNINVKAQLHSFHVFKDSIQDNSLCNYAFMITFGNICALISRTGTHFTEATTAVLQNLNSISLKMICTPWPENRKTVNMQTSCFHSAFFKIQFTMQDTSIQRVR